MRILMSAVAIGVAASVVAAGAAFAGPAALSVPEPATVSLLAAGVGVLALARHFRRK